MPAAIKMEPEELWRLAGNLRRLRVARGWTMRDVAERIGHHHSVIGRLERAATAAPSAELIMALARLYGTTTDALMEQFGYDIVVSPNGYIDHWEDVAMLTAPPTRLISARYGDHLVLLAPIDDAAEPSEARRVVLLHTPAGRRLCTVAEAAALAGTIEAVEVSRWNRQ